MAINCVIIEDEPLALERTKSFVARLPFVNVIACFENGLDALLFLKGNAVDLIFLDINIGEITGIQLLEAAKPGCEVIIITAYHEYAIKGFELQVTDYLLKPFTFERFFQAVERAQANLLRKESPKERKFLFLKTEYRLEKILLAEILYIEGMRDYRRIHTTGKPIMTLQTFKEFEQLVPPDVICRVHKSYMVALDKIESVERDRIKIENTFIPISDTYKNAFFSLIKR